jgi:uncharacterized protein involved in exopolysaccharide biosynthesis
MPQDSMSVAAEAVRRHGMFDLLLPLAASWRLLVTGTLLAAAIAAGASYLITPLYTARVTFLPPQQQQNTAATALASLGALTGLAGATGGLKTPADQYVALAQSVTVADLMLDRFDLMTVYEEEYRVDARRELARKVRIGIGKKDGIVSIEVDDESPQRAADMANRFVDELRELTNRLALTEAQQRRVFFEAHLQATRDKLVQAQHALLASGFGPDALKAEPRTAAEGYARLRAEVTAATVRLEALRRNLTADAAEVQQQQAGLGVLRAQLTQMEATAAQGPSADYVGKYREFKYQETLFELFARQYELARVDESRDGGLIQVIDAATPPEKRSWPRRAIITAAAATSALLLLMVYVISADALQRPGENRLGRLRDAFRRR